MKRTDLSDSSFQMTSDLDESVNFVTQSPDGGFYESRYVHRPGTDYVICYLSSHSGCSQGCTMCHLTTTGQTMMRYARIEDLMAQARPVLSHAKKIAAQLGQLPRITFSFMARGEPLLNPVVTGSSTALFLALADEARQFLPEVMVNFSLSTIMPKGANLVKSFPVIHPKIYFSAYSANDELRSKLVPNGMSFYNAAQQLVEYSLMTKRICTVHGAFIKDVNDNLPDVYRIAGALSGGYIGANIVRLNPPEGSGMEEASPAFLLDAELMYREKLRGPVKVVTRVGPDVNASCGMFVKGA